MLSVSLDRLFFIASSVFSNVYLLVCSVSCVPNVVSVSGLSCIYCIFGILALTFIYYSVLCLVYLMLSVSLDCLFFIASSVFSNVYLLVCSVSCVPNVVSVSGLSFFPLHLRYSLTFIY